MTKVNPVQLQKSLNEVDYPTSKKDLIKHAEQKGVDEKVLHLLKQLPLEEYETSGAVSQAIANIE